MSSWLFLLVAALFEMTWPVSLTYSEGWRRFWPSVLTLVTSLASFYCLAHALNPRRADHIPVGTGYAIWTGLGAVGAAVIGYVFFHEEMSLTRAVCLLLIVGGVVGLKLTAPVH